VPKLGLWLGKRFGDKG
jgi:Transposase DDE domain